MKTKLYNVICWYNDVFFGWIHYYELKSVSKEEAEDFVKSKEHSDDIYKIVEVEL